MSLRYQKRIGRSAGLGFNVSNSGISPSYRTKYGTFGSRGFSIRTGIPGLTFRSSYGGKSKGSGALVIFAVIATLAVLYVAVVIAYNVILFLWWAGKTIVLFAYQHYCLWQDRKKIRFNIKMQQFTDLPNSQK